MLAALGDVTSVGYGPAPSKAATHLQIPDGLSGLPETVIGAVRLGLRAHRSAEMSAPAARFARSNLQPGTWDLVVANDARTLDIAHELAGGAPIWVDLREWAPEEWSDIWRWRTFVGPFMRHLCRRYLPNVAIATTVGPKLIEMYEEQFGVAPLLMRNAPRFQNIQPSPTSDDRVRLVHGGAAIHGRGIDELFDVVERLPEMFTLDLYLVPSRDMAFHAHLVERAATNPRITVRPPVPALDVSREFSQYDVGVYFLPWTNTNTKYSLPNKFFDFVQARLAIAVGPSPEMQRIVTEEGIGVVATAFDPASAATAIAALTPQRVRKFKAAAAIAAPRLSFEADEQTVLSVLSSLLRDSANAQSASST
jgi:glycosyltransferase involved in cell wall biosynthesis